MAEVSQTLSVERELQRALDADAEAAKVYRSEKEVAMNGLARSIIEQGPTNKLSAFLYAMHGQRMGYGSNEPTPLQNVYQSMRNSFGLNAIDTIFTKTDAGEFSHRASRHLISRKVFELFMSDLGSFDFSAVYFDIREEQDGFEGAAYVPTFSTVIGAHGRIKCRQDTVVLGSTFRSFDRTDAPTPDYEPGDMRFGTKVLQTTDVDGVLFGIEELHRQEYMLRNFAATAKPEPVPSPYR